MPSDEAVSQRTLLKLEQAAVRLGVSRSQVQRLIGAGELAVVHLGPKLLRIPVEAVEQFQAKQRQRMKPKTTAQYEVREVPVSNQCPTCNQTLMRQWELDATQAQDALKAMRLSCATFERDNGCQLISARVHRPQGPMEDGELTAASPDDSLTQVLLIYCAHAQPRDVHIRFPDDTSRLMAQDVNPDGPAIRYTVAIVCALLRLTPVEQGT